MKYIKYQNKDLPILDSLLKFNENHIYFCKYKYICSSSDCIEDVVEICQINEKYPIMYDFYPESKINNEHYYFSMFIFPNCNNLDIDKIFKLKSFI